MNTPPQRGFCCPRCPGEKLYVTTTTRPCRGRIVRYRRCRRCGYKDITVEQRSGGRAGSSQN